MQLIRMHGTVSHNYLNKNILPYGAKNVNTSKMLPPVFAVSVSLYRRKNTLNNCAKQNGFTYHNLHYFLLVYQEGFYQDKP